MSLTLLLAPSLLPIAPVLCLSPLQGLRPFVTSNVFEGYGAPSRTPSPRAARAGGSLLLSAVFAGGRVRSLLRPRKELSATTTWRSLTSPRLASFGRVQDDITEPLYRDVDIYAAPQDVVSTTMLPDTGIPPMGRSRARFMHDPANGFPRRPIIGSRVNKGNPLFVWGWHEHALSTKRCGVNALLLAQPGLVMGYQAG